MASPILTIHPLTEVEYVAMITPGDVIRHVTMYEQLSQYGELPCTAPADLVHEAVLLLLESQLPEELPEDIELATYVVVDPGFLPSLRARLAAARRSNGCG